MGAHCHRDSSRSTLHSLPRQCQQVLCGHFHRHRRTIRRRNLPSRALCGWRTASADSWLPCVEGREEELPHHPYFFFLLLKLLLHVLHIDQLGTQEGRVDQVGASHSNGLCYRTLLHCHHPHSSDDRQPKIARHCLRIDGNDAEPSVGSVPDPNRRHPRNSRSRVIRIPPVIDVPVRDQLPLSWDELHLEVS